MMFMLVTKNGYTLRFNIEEVPVIGAKAAGVQPSILRGYSSGDLIITQTAYILTQRVRSSV